MQDLKFAESLRTFETRLQFLNEIYSDKHDNLEILAKCIGHKLNRNYEAYLAELRAAAYEVEQRKREELKILRNLK